MLLSHILNIVNFKLAVCACSVRGASWAQTQGLRSRHGAQNHEKKKRKKKKKKDLKKNIEQIKAVILHSKCHEILLLPETLQPGPSPRSLPLDPTRAFQQATGPHAMRLVCVACFSGTTGEGGGRGHSAPRDFPLGNLC